MFRDSDRVKDAIEHTELCVWSFCDEKVMSQHSEISKKIQAETRRRGPLKAMVKEKISIKVVIECAEALQQVFGKVSDFIGIKITNVNAIPKTMSVGKKNHFYLSLSEPVSLNCLKVQLRERFTEKILSGTVEASGTGEGTFFPSKKNYWTISVAPESPDNYELEICAYGFPFEVKGNLRQPRPWSPPPPPPPPPPRHYHSPIYYHSDNS